MTDSIKFNVVNENQETVRTFTAQVEDKALVNSIMTVGKDNAIQETDIETFQSTAAKAGDAGILEHADLNGEQKIKLAEQYGFDDYYTMEVVKTSDGTECIKITPKDKSMHMNPNIDVIKSDFGIPDNVLVKKGGIIPYDNGKVFEDASGNYDGVQISSKESLNIPVSEINITDTPAGGVYRFFSWLRN